MNSVGRELREISCAVLAALILVLAFNPVYVGEWMFKVRSAYLYASIK